MPASYGTGYLTGISTGGLSGKTVSSGRSLAGLGSQKTGSSGSTGYGSSYDYLRQISEANNAFNLAQVDMVNAFNAREAQKNRDWQERMSRNAHQYEVEDLIKAGLNPIMSAGGQGAYVGSGGVASGQKAVADDNYANGVIALMTSAMSAASAENVARIYANASKYGSDLQFMSNKGYHNVLRENNLSTNSTSAENNVRSNIYGLFDAGIRALGYGLLYKGYKKSGFSGRRY